MKNLFNKTFSIVFVILSLFLGTLSIQTTRNYNEQIELERNTTTRSIPQSNLKDDVESLSFSINLVDETVSYDIKFATSDFNNTQTQSYFFYIQDQTWYGISEWGKFYFSGSQATVKNREASNTTSYQEIYSFPEINFVTNYQRSSSLSVAYEKDGELVAATHKPIRLQFFYLEDLGSVDNSATKMTINDEKTYAQVDFSIAYDTTSLSVDQISLKSHSDSDLNQVIYDIDNNLSLIQGNNKISFRLLSDYRYQDLYLEFTFLTYQNAAYIYDSDITNIDEFTSGITNKATFDKNALILLIILIILILLMIIFIVLIVMLIQKRRQLEKKNKKEYYDSHYEDGIK